MHIKYFITVLALSVGLCLPAGDATAKDKLPPLMIQEQGVSRQGEKSSQRPVRLTPVPRQIPRGKHCMEIMPTSFIRFR